MEQSSLDFGSVVAILRSLNELPEAPSESCKILGFRSALEDDDQPASSYCLPVGSVSWYSLSDIDDHISSPSSMCSKKVSKLLPYAGVRSRRFEVEEETKTRSLNHHVTELAGVRFFENLNRMDVILFFYEAEDTKAAMWSILEATSWMDWWTFTIKSLALKSSSDVRLVLRLSVAGARCQLLVVKMASTLWANLVLKRRDAVLEKVKDSISF